MVYSPAVSIGTYMPAMATPINRMAKMSLEPVNIIRGNIRENPTR